MKKNIICIIAIFIGILLTACSSKESEKEISVRIAFFPNITHSQALVGIEKGKFEEQMGNKCKIEWKKFDAGSTEMEAILAKGIDIGYIGPGPAINGYIKSKGDVKIIAGTADAGAILVARKDLNINTISQLNGKKVAVPQFGNTQDLSLRYLLNKNNLKDVTKGGSVEIVQAANPDIKTLLDKKDIDAALVPEPWGSRLEKEIGANVVLDFDKIWRDGKYSTAVVIVRKDFLKEYPDVVKNFIKAHVELTDYINSNQSEAKKIVQKQIEQITKKSLGNDILDSSFKRLTITNNPEKESIKEMMKLEIDSGFIKADSDIKDIFDLDILNEVLKEKGIQKID